MAQLICGILRLDGGSPDEELARHMAATMVAPGLGHQMRIASHGPVVMAAIRLASRLGGPAVSPALIEDDDALVVADISIYDRTRLGLPSNPAADPSDAALLRSILIQKRECGLLGGLHGDFSFAEWRSGCLTLGRDHFGARPLVYVERPGHYLAFASSPAALLYTGLADPALDEAVVASWALQPSPPPGRTIYRDIRTVDAAHVLECKGGAVKTRRYWRLGTRARLPFSSDPCELAAEIARLLTQAVERRIPADGPGAGHLSGGLDSSPIAVLAARSMSRSGRSFFGYTFREPEHGPGLPGTGDAPLADLVAAAETSITQVPIISPSLLVTYGDSVDPATLLALSDADPEEQVLQHAAGQGARVVLSGWGGDQIASYQGRGAELELFRTGNLAQLWRSLRAETKATGIGTARLFLSTVLLQGVTQKRRETLRRLFGRARPFLEVMESSSRLVAKHRRDILLVESWADDGDSHDIRRGSVEAWYVQTRLGSLAHQGSRHAITYAYPLLDLDLVEFSMQVPGMFLRNAGKRRVLFRQALAGILPDEIRFDPVKHQPFPGEGLRNAAAGKHLLAILRKWGNNTRIHDFLDLEFMTQMTRLACDPAAADPAGAGDLAAIDLTPAFQIASLLDALGNLPVIAHPLNQAVPDESGA